MNARILVIDDHPLVRAGIKRAVTVEDRLQVVGEAATKREALVQITHHKPDAIVVDLNLPDGSGLEIIEWSRSRSQRMGIVALTVLDLPEHIRACMQSGASAHVNKSAPIDQLIAAILQSIRAPLSFQSRKLTAALAMANVDYGLTPRELEILEILPSGETITEIASRLFLSVATIKTHIGSIYRKLEVKNRVQAINKARRAGLLQQ
jgi:DNA-binding NarL/FixJ family response regulator